MTAPNQQQPPNQHHQQSSILERQEQHAAATAEAVPVMPGGLDAEYVVGPAIGKGGYALVHKGSRRRDGLVVAIKRVDIDTMAPKKRERCIKEVTLLQRLNHPHVLTCFDAFIDQQLVIITEWAPGGDLKKLIRRMAEAGRRFDEPEIWLYLSQIVDALCGLHRARIIHRDIKPANVLVCAGGVLKLGDLGLGRQLGPQTVDVLSKVGTPFYCSPEVVKGIRYGFASDLWGLGCLLYELCLLRSPFEAEGANLYDVFQRIAKGSWDPLPPDRFSPALRGLVTALLDQDPAARPSAEQLWQQLQAMQAQQQQQSLVSHQGSLNGRQQQGTAVQGTAGNDVCLLSEHATASLLVVSSLVCPAPAGKTVSKRSRIRSGGSAAAADPGAISALLRQLHPLFFALPPSAFGGCCSSSRSKGKQQLPPDMQQEQEQRMQLGAVVQVCAWLSELNGKLDAAQLLRSELQSPGRRSANGSSSSCDGGSSPWPCCKDCLKSADALRRAAQSMAVRSELLESWAPAELAAGHGRTVCGLLQALLDETKSNLQLTCRRCSHATPSGSCEDVQHVGDSDAECGADVGAAATAAGAVSSSRQDSLDLELPDLLDRRRVQQQQPLGVLGTQPPIRSQVDALAWWAEAERLAPQLARVQHQQHAHGPGDDWAARWQALRQLQQQCSRQAPTVLAGLSHVSARLSGQLEQLERQEQRLNQQLQEPLGRYAALRDEADALLQQQAQKEEAILAIQQELSAVANRLQEVQAQVAERTNRLQGSVQLQRQRTAVQALTAEVQQMECRLGLLHHQLVLAKQQQWRQRAFAEQRQWPAIVTE